MKRRRFNWVMSDVLRKFAKFYLETSARLSGKTFYCKALSGESEYNLTINCDLTVSCNCQDYNGSGHLGDLNKQTFSEVFFGPVSQRFRAELAQGKIPIKSCTRCGDLARVSKSDIKRVAVPRQEPRFAKPAATPTSANGTLAPELFAGPVPQLPHRGMLLENTVRCNIDCVGCDRQQAAGLRFTKQMELDKLTRMADLVHDLGLEQLFYLNLGEPFLSPNIGKELPILREKNPNCRIIISTNGIILNNDVKREAAMSASHLYFSIAGINDEMLKKYEKLGSFEKAYTNIKALVDYRNARGLSSPTIEWKYLLFNWNDHPRTLARAVKMARAAGVDYFSIWPTNNPYYGYSWRYRLGLLNHVGEKCWKGREIDMRKPAPARSTGAVALASS
jgi:hypothetical protein